ncbi:NACHT domain-containing protein [Streptomyces sp. NPDC018059]|uniref:NACHT domain-containing protein n=1 Tax=Streptomyces sp. NPDC018059 TaxID=3365041 RepID=UPI0037B3C1F5
MGSESRRARAALWWVGVAVAVPVVVALAWAVRALRDEKLDPGDQAGVLGFGAAAVGILISVASLVLAWMSYRADRRESASVAGAAGIADAFADAVRKEWEAEARLRRLNDPYALPVSWIAAPDELTEAWGDLTARPGARAVPATPADGTDGTDRADGTPSPPQIPSQRRLSGRDNEIGELFQEWLPFSRLVILGEPGSGKSMLLVRLLLDLCARRSSGDPVPVLLSLSSWDPAAEELDAWLERQLRTHHPALAAVHAGSTQARALLDHRLVLLLLDGFDEMAPAAQAVALDRINRALPVGHPFLLSSRTEEYRRALTPANGVPVRLNGAAAIVLEPLDSDTTATYLVRDGGGSQSAAADRWAPVLAQFGTDTPVGRALDTPLALFLARTIYNPRPGESSGGLPDPGELLDERRFPDADAVRTHLFEAYVPAAYRPHPEKPCRWTSEQAERYLSFLAGRLLARGGGTDIAWWSVASWLPWGGADTGQVGCPDGCDVAAVCGGGNFRPGGSRGEYRRLRLRQTGRTRGGPPVGRCRFGAVVGGPAQAAGGSGCEAALAAEPCLGPPRGDLGRRVGSRCGGLLDGGRAVWSRNQRPDRVGGAGRTDRVGDCARRPRRGDLSPPGVG